MDDTGCFTTQSPFQLFALKGAKQFGLATSTECGTLVTRIGILHAIGNIVPSYFIYHGLTS